MFRGETVTRLSPSRLLFISKNEFRRKLTNMNIVKIPKASYERNIPTSLEQAMEELDRRIMITVRENLGQVQARVIFRELLQDFMQGLESKSSYIIRP